MNKPLNLRPHGMQGKLITFCGLDGCGKSTMIRMLHEDLKNCGFDVLLTKQPTEEMRQSPIFRTFMDSEDHSQYSYRSLSLMAAADRVQHCNHMIMKALDEGKIVICDRYLYSCLANLRARGYEKDQWLYEISAKEIPKPDLALFLDVPVEVAVARVRQREEEKDRYIDLALQHRLRREYQKICKENNGVLIPSVENIRGTYLKIIDHVTKHIGGKQK